MKTLPLAILALLPACAMTPPEGPATPPAPPAAASDYRASGTEPFWTVAIEGDQLTYRPLEGPMISARVPVAEVTTGGRRYKTPRITLDIAHVRCSDGMSDRSYPDTVTATVDGRKLRGCGAPVEGAALSLTGPWRVVRVGTIDVSDATIAFDGQRLTGRVCNRFSGSYRLSGRALTAGPVAATRMACEGPRMAAEIALIAALESPVLIERAGDNATLIARDGRRILLMR